MEEEPGGFWGSDFGKGLGYVINNPVTRVVTTPLNYIQTGGRAITLGLEELAENVPVLGDIADIVVDTERTEADKRSNWEKIFNPNTTYGFGEIAESTGNKWLDRAVGLAGDIALDPLTYLTAGGSRIVAGVSHVDEAADALRLASEGLEIAEAVGDAAQVKKATDAVRRAEEYVTKAPKMGVTPSREVRLPRNRAERVDMFGELSETKAGRQFLEEFPGEVRRGGQRGLQTMSQEAKEAIGIQRPGLRVRGIGRNVPILGSRIPLTGPIAQGLSSAGGAVRAKIPQAGRIGAMRVPRGLEAAFATLTRDAEGDVLLAATDVGVRNNIRLGTGAMQARGNRILSHAVRNEMKAIRKAAAGNGDEAIRKLVVEAETSATPNLLNNIAGRLLDVYQEITGRVINKAHLLDPDTYFPHLLDPKFRRALAIMHKRGDKAAIDFMEKTGTHTDELLEEGAFYLDNMIEGSGFLEKSRKLGANPDGTPRTMVIGGKEITFERSDLGHINEQLRKAFPTYRGDFYDMDPVRVFEAYNTSLARQAGRDKALQRLVETSNPLVTRMTGDLDKTYKALNEALSMQGAAPLLKTAQGTYDPTQPLPTVGERPVVPGSAEDKARRAAIAEAEAAAKGPMGAEDLDFETYFRHLDEGMDEAEAFAAAGGRAFQEPTFTMPQPAERFGDIDPNDLLPHHEGHRGDRRARRRGEAGQHLRPCRHDGDARRRSRGTTGVEGCQRGTGYPGPHQDRRDEEGDHGDQLEDPPVGEEDHRVRPAERRQR